MDPVDRFKEIRKKLGLTQTELGLAFGLKREHITSIETRKVKISPLHAIAMEYLYGVNKEWIMKGTGDPYLTKPEPGHIKVISEHQDLIKRYADPVQGKEINEQLIDIQDTDKTLFQSAVNSIKSLWDTAMTIRQVKGQKTDQGKNLKNGTEGW